MLVEKGLNHDLSTFFPFNKTNKDHIIYATGVCTPVSGILTGKKYAKQYTTNLVLILYIRILNI